MSLPGARIDSEAAVKSARCANVSSARPLCRRAFRPASPGPASWRYSTGNDSWSNVNPSLAGTRASQRAGSLLIGAKGEIAKAIVLLNLPGHHRASSADRSVSKPARRTRGTIRSRGSTPPFVDTSAHPSITRQLRSVHGRTVANAQAVCNRADSERRTQLG